VKSAIVNALSLKMNVVIDNTNLEAKHIYELKELATENTEISYKVFGENMTAKELYERVKDRNDVHVSLKIIKKQIGKLNELVPKLPEIFSSDDKPFMQFSNDKSLTNAIVVDMDGTLALNTNGRSPYDMTRVDEDEPNEKIVVLTELLSFEFPIIVCSARDECSRQLTEEWLDKYNITYEKLYLRKDGDKRKDCIVKEEMWRDISTKYNIYLMLDDRNQVVKHARKLGLKVCQVAEGDF
jgi:hypothetical protein